MTGDPNYPAGSSQGYASPLQLRRGRNGAWTAAVTPLSDDYTLFLKIFTDSDGTLRAAFRNPQLHDHGPAMQLTVSQSGNALRFSPPPDSREKPIDATMLEPNKRLQVTWPPLGKNVILTPATPLQAARFYARDWPSKKYTYLKPAMTGDGWSTARAASLGVDENALSRAVQRIIDIDPASQRAWLIHSISIAYRGRLILDEYFYGHDRDDVHDTRSASKTFANVMLGAAAVQGTPIPIDTKLYDAVSALGPFANPDPRKAKITLENLLTHTSGLACDDNNDASPGNEDAMETQRQQPNWWKYTLDLPMAYEPGSHYAYCSANINLVGAILGAQTHQWIPELFDATVAKPLEFGPYYWNVMPNGNGYLGGGAFIRPRDFLKIGQVYLDGGTWRGRRIVPAAWVADSLKAHAHISPQTTGLTGDAFMQNYYDTDEGLAWHILPVKTPNRTYPAYFANGNGGQLLMLVPQFQLAVMFTAGNYGQGVWNRERDDIVGGMIIPALPADAAPR